MYILTIDPHLYDVWSAFPNYFLEQSPFYVQGDVTSPTAFIEVVGHGIVAEAEVLLVETVLRPEDRYWLVPTNGEVATYSLIDILQLDFTHPLLREDMYGSNDTYEQIRQKWSDGYRVPSSKWTRETYEAHLFKERLYMTQAATTMCSVCQIDLATRYGKGAYRVMEYHLTESKGIWVCPTCHKAIHYLE